MKIYDTGIGVWEYGQGTDFYMGKARHILLGPCPLCGRSTFDYGGGWRCNEPYCFNSANNSLPNLGEAPDWWNTNINIKKDGNMWCAFYDDFINLQESPAGFGETPQKAVDELKKYSEELTR
jgi:hypothetical protein